MNDDAIKSRLQRVRRFFWRAPDFIIGTRESPYMRRWWVIPRNRRFNIYLHNIVRSDDDRALHDHPWWNVSILLRGYYREVTPDGVFTRGRGSIVFRRAEASHRLEVDGPTWSLFITGPNVREWGFWCPQGWKHWRKFVDMTDTGAVGPGCGEGP